MLLVEGVALRQMLLSALVFAAVAVPQAVVLLLHFLLLPAQPDLLTWQPVCVHVCMFLCVCAYVFFVGVCVCVCVYDACVSAVQYICVRMCVNIHIHVQTHAYKHNTHGHTHGRNTPPRLHGRARMDMYLKQLQIYTIHTSA